MLIIIIIIPFWGKTTCVCMNAKQLCWIHLIQCPVASVMLMVVANSMTTDHVKTGKVNNGMLCRVFVVCVCNNITQTTIG